MAGQEMTLPTQDFSKYQWRDDGGVGFDDETGCGGAKLAPSDFLVRDSAGIRAVARGRIADLTKVAPSRHGCAQILIQHRDHEKGKISGNAAADLKEADARIRGFAAIPPGQLDHVLDARSGGK